MLVYDTRQFLDIRKTTALWRKLVRTAGFEDVYLVRCNTFVAQAYEIDPAVQGFDACVEFPPHGTSTAQVPLVESKSPSNDGAHNTHPSIFDQETVVFDSITRTAPSYELFRALFPSWDNTPRKKQDATVYFGSSPSLYEAWLRELIEWSRRHNSPEKQLIFINAWNEWAEGAVLEPDREHGRQYLEATKRALTDSTERDGSTTVAKLARLALNCRLSPAEAPSIAEKTLKKSDLILSELEKAGFGESGFYVEGWAFVKGSTNAPLVIVVFDDKELIGSTFTTLYRPDLAERFGAGALRSGFSLHCPKYLKAKGTIHIFAFSEDLVFQTLERKTALYLEA